VQQVLWHLSKLTAAPLVLRPELIQAH